MPAQDEEMIRAYFGGEPTPAERGRIVIYKAMCDLLWTLWGLIQHRQPEPGRRFLGLFGEPLQPLQGPDGDGGVPQASCGGGARLRLSCRVRHARTAPPETERCMNRADCEALDRADPLAPKRALFAIPDGLNYLDGNSLGVLPRGVAERVAATVTQQWGETLIRSWNEHGWFALPQKVGDRIAKLVGAAPGTVIAGDTISINLFKLLGAALKLRPDRKVILSDSGNFPSDLYVAQGLRDLLGGGHVLRIVEPRRRGASHRRHGGRRHADGSGLPDRAAA